MTCPAISLSQDPGLPRVGCWTSHRPTRLCAGTNDGSCPHKPTSFSPSCCQFQQHPDHTMVPATVLGTCDAAACPAHLTSGFSVSS